MVTAITTNNYQNYTQKSSVFNNSKKVNAIRSKMGLWEKLLWIPT